MSIKKKFKSFVRETAAEIQSIRDSVDATHSGVFDRATEIENKSLENFKTLTGIIDELRNSVNKRTAGDDGAG